METGVLNEESLSSIFRAAAQRRRNGVLEITYPDRVFNIYFNKGKVVEAYQAGVNAVDSIVVLLKAAGYLPQGFTTTALGYNELFLACADLPPLKGIITEVLFRRVVKHRVLNELYSLELQGGAYYTFRMQMVESDKDFSPSISTGQILLDFVSLATDRERFVTMFGPDTLVFKGQFGEGLSEEETVIFEELSPFQEGSEAKGRRVAELHRFTMLSRFSLQDTLLGMYERGAIATHDGVVALSPVSAEMGSVQEDASNSEVLEGAAVSKVSRLSLITQLPKVIAHTLSDANQALLKSEFVPTFFSMILLLAAFVLPVFFWFDTLVAF